MGNSGLRQVGSRIRTARQAKGLGVAELAERVGISKGYISQLENGTGGANPTLDVLKRIADALDVTLADLVGSPRAQSREPLPDSLPEGLKQLITELKSQGEPLEPATVRWLANANFRGQRPKSKDDFRMLLHVLRASTRD